MSNARERKSIRSNQRQEAFKIRVGTLAQSSLHQYFEMKTLIPLYQIQCTPQDAMANNDTFKAAQADFLRELASYVVELNAFSPDVARDLFPEWIECVTASDSLEETIEETISSDYSDDLNIDSVNSDVSDDLNIASEVVKQLAVQSVVSDQIVTTQNCISSVGILLATENDSYLGMITPQIQPESCLTYDHKPDIQSGLCVDCGCEVIHCSCPSETRVLLERHPPRTSAFRVEESSASIFPDVVMRKIQQYLSCEDRLRFAAAFDVQPIPCTKEHGAVDIQKVSPQEALCVSGQFTKFQKLRCVCTTQLYRNFSKLRCFGEVLRFLYRRVTVRPPEIFRVHAKFKNRPG